MAFDARGGIRDFLKANGIPGLDKGKQLAAAARAVSRIPWGECRTIEDVLIKKAGTCTGKHLVLQACLEELGTRYRPVVCTFRWGEQPIAYPENLRAILNEGEWEHGHNFVQIPKEDGTFIDLDVTWNPELKPYGFRALPEDWAGQTPFVGVDKIIRRWDGADIGSMKKTLIDSLGPEARERRGRFLKELIKWVGSINGKLKVTSPS